MAVMASHQKHTQWNKITQMHNERSLLVRRMQFCHGDVQYWGNPETVDEVLVPESKQSPSLATKTIQSSVSKGCKGFSPRLCEKLLEHFQLYTQWRGGCYDDWYGRGQQNNQPSKIDQKMWELQLIGLPWDEEINLMGWTVNPIQPENNIQVNRNLHKIVLQLKHRMRQHLMLLTCKEFCSNVT